MEKYIHLTSLKGSQITLTRAGATVKAAVAGATGGASGFLVSADNGALTLSNGTTIEVGPEEAARARDYLHLARTTAAPMSVPLIVALCIGGAFILLFIIAAVSGGSKTPSATPAPQVAGAEPGPSTAKVESPKPDAEPLGYYVQQGDAAIGVTNVDLRDKVGDDFLEERAAEGGVLVVVHYKVKNTGDKPIKSFDLPKLKLIDPTGTEYDLDIGKTSSYASEARDNMKALSDLNPDIAVEDSAVFEVSKTRFDKATWRAITSNGTKIALQ